MKIKIFIFLIIFTYPFAVFMLSVLAYYMAKIIGKSTN